MKKTMKRNLAALVLSGGAALALTPAVAHADGPVVQGDIPITKRVVEIADHPAQTVTDAKTAVGATASAAGSATKATDASLSGAGTALTAGLPKAPGIG
ncbi:hypothetical protein ACFXEL_05630 [Streptomyces sp. NPDC059382]|uniref:hypothetical protein n=1 Tax=unclassified Streptomyces TaxID=2593676 RepID=UPI003325527D